MRILALVTDAFGGYGGIAKFNQDFLSSLCSHPAVEEVVALPRLQPEPPGRLPMKLDYNASGVGGKIRYTMAVLKSAIGHRKPAVIFCAHINLLPVAFALRLLCRAPVILIIHGIESWQPTRSRLANFLARRIDAFISVSDFTRQRFLNWTKLNQTKSFILPDSIDLTRFGPGPKPEGLLTRYGLRGRTVMMTLARLSASERYKGIDEVLETMPSLVSEIPGLSYLICGEGDDRERLEQKAEQLGLRDRVVFTGYISEKEKEKAGHYRLADVFVMPGRGEGFGIVYLEAMACGIPVIGSQLDASREVLRNGALGIVVDPSNPREIVSAIKKSLQMEKNVPSGLNHFSFPNFERRCHELLSSIVNAD